MSQTGNKSITPDIQERKSGKSARQGVSEPSCLHRQANVPNVFFATRMASRIRRRQRHPHPRRVRNIEPFRI